MFLSLTTDVTVSRQFKNRSYAKYTAQLPSTLARTLNRDDGSFAGCAEAQEPATQQPGHTVSKARICETLQADNLASSIHELQGDRERGRKSQLTD